MNRPLLGVAFFVALVVLVGLGIESRKHSAPSHEEARVQAADSDVKVTVRNDRANAMQLRVAAPDGRDVMVVNVDAGASYEVMLKRDSRVSVHDKSGAALRSFSVKEAVELWFIAEK